MQPPENRADVVPRAAAHQFGDRAISHHHAAAPQGGKRDLQAVGRQKGPLVFSHHHAVEPEHAPSGARALGLHGNAQLGRGLGRDQVSAKGSQGHGIAGHRPRDNAQGPYPAVEQDGFEIARELDYAAAFAGQVFYLLRRRYRTHGRSTQDVPPQADRPAYGLVAFWTGK